MATLDADAWYELGIQALQARQFPEAEVAFRTAVKAEPRHAAALYRLGEVSDMRGLRADAAWFYMRTLEIEPDHLSARQQLARLNSGSADAPSGQPGTEKSQPSSSKPQSDYYLPTTDEDFADFRK